MTKSFVQATGPGEFADVINETSLEISHQYQRWQTELEIRYARRNKVRHIDKLLNHLELLNLAGSSVTPAPLRREVLRLLGEAKHPLSGPKERGLSVPDAMEALYDIQDTLLLGSEEEEER